MSIAIEKSTAKHTPAPWNIEYQMDGDADLISGGPEHVSIATLCKVGANTGSNLPDAKLIAAAPELLEALRDAHTLLLALRTKVSDADAPLINNWIKDARTAIAKTE